MRVHVRARHLHLEGQKRHLGLGGSAAAWLQVTLPTAKTGRKVRFHFCEAALRPEVEA